MDLNYDSAEKLSPMSKNYDSLNSPNQNKTLGIETQKSSEIHEKLVSFKEFKKLRKIDRISDLFKIGKKLGEGEFGTVRQAWHKLANMDVAIKMISKDQIEKNIKQKQLIFGELSVLEETSHPNIMHIYELLHDESRYYIVSEYIQYGELFKWLEERE